MSYEEKEYLRKQGEYFGYPPCCIKYFIKTKGAIGNKLGGEAGRLDNRGTGFIPCKYHAKKILNGDLDLKDLIQSTRKEKLPFPNSNVLTNPYISDEVKKRYKKYVSKK